MQRTSFSLRLAKAAFSVFLSIVLAVSLVPSAALAETTDSTEDEATETVEEATATEEAESTEESDSTVTSEESSSATGTESSSAEEVEDEETTTVLTSGSYESSANSWRYVSGSVLANPNTDSELSALSTYPYSTWKSSYGTSYLGIVKSSSTTTKVKVSGVKRVVIDVSKWNGSINWKKVAAAGVTGAIIRCGYGSNYTSQDDSQFIANVQGAQKYGIDIGVYLYSYATTTSAAKSEAKHVLRLLDKAGLDPDDLDMPVYLDMENSTQASLSASELGTIAETFCDAIEAEGYPVGIYANENWWTNYLTDGVFSSTTNPTWYKWVARYPASTSITSAGVSGTDMWQFTSAGTVSGISGNVDVNFDYVGADNYATPSKVTLKSATVASDYSAVTLKWSKVSNVSGYRIYRKTSSGSYELVKTITSTSTTSWTDSSVELGKSYTYRMRAYRTKTDGETKLYGAYSTTKTVLTKPKQVTISSASKNSAFTSVTLQWASISDASGYEIRRSTDGGSSYSVIATITNTSTLKYTDSGLTPGSTYYYQVRAYRNITSESSSGTTTTTKVNGSYSSAEKVYMGPSTVTISSAATTTAGAVKVTWKKVSNATGYVIYRSVNGGSYSKVKTISKNTTLSWTNTSVSAGKVYRYKIKAYYTSGSTTLYSESYSSVKKVTAKPAKVTISSVKSTAKRSGTVKWKKVSGATGYQVAYRIKGKSKWYYVTVKSTSKKFTSLRNKNYYVKVRAYKTYNGKKYYGSWSSQKAMKVK